METGEAKRRSRSTLSAHRTPVFTPKDLPWILTKRSDAERELLVKIKHVVAQHRVLETFTFGM